MAKRYQGRLKRDRFYRDIGHYTLPFGKSDTQFDFDYPLMTVLTACPASGLPVCQGDLNWFSVTLLDKGFILHADVRTDTATVTWVTIEGMRSEADKL